MPGLAAIIGLGSEADASHFGSFRQRQRVFSIYPQVAHRALKFGVAEQDLHRPQIAGSALVACHLSTDG